MELLSLLIANPESAGVTGGLSFFDLRDVFGVDVEGFADARATAAGIGAAFRDGEGTTGVD